MMEKEWCEIVKHIKQLSKAVAKADEHDAIIKPVTVETRDLWKARPVSVSDELLPRIRAILGN